MEGYYADELYAILDELNAGIEDVFNSLTDEDSMELMISKLRQKEGDFITELEHEVEKLDMFAVEI